MGIGKRVKDLRVFLKYSQTELANMLEITPSSVNAFEKDKTKPSIKTLQLLAEKLDANLNWVVLGLGDMLVGSSIGKTDEIDDNFSQLLKESIRLNTIIAETSKSAVEATRVQAESSKKVTETALTIAANSKSVVETNNSITNTNALLVKEIIALKKAE